MKKVFFFLIILLHLTSCGKKRESSRMEVFLREEEIQDVLENQSFTCAPVEGSECPEGVARVFVIDPINPSRSALCTGFLTGRNTLVTNEHCVRDAASCAHTYVAIYKKGGHEIARCSSVIKILSDNQPLVTKALDVAVLTLDRSVPIRPLRVASRSPNSGTNVSAWVFDHLDLLQGRLTELRCETETPGASGEFSQCPAISGNSGSPVLSRGRVVGVLWGSTLDSTFTGNLDLELRRDLPATSFATKVEYFRSYSLP